MTGALPPSSRWVRLTVLAAACSTFLPVATSPVIDTIADLRVIDQGIADALAAAEHDVDDAFRQDIGEQLRHLAVQ